VFRTPTISWAFLLPKPRNSILAAATLAASLLAAMPPEHSSPGEPAEEAGPYPSDWFGAQRAFPGATVNQDAYLAALEWARVERAVAQLSTESATPMVWAEAGPFNIGGRVTALAVAPGGGTVFLGAAAGGVHRSNDSGVTWTQVFDQVASIGALAMDPADPDVVYVGTGEANAAIDNYDGAGLYRTADGGSSWSYLGLQETRRIARVRIDPANPARIFVAAMGSQFSTGPHRGLYRSENGGASWTKVLFANDSTGVCEVVLHPTHPETVYCATWERIRRPTYRRVFGPGCAIWRSADHGTTWTKLTAGLPASSDNVGRIALAIAPTMPSRIYAQIIGGPAQNLDGLGLYRSDDGGTTWSRKDTGGFVGAFGGFGWYFGDVAVSPSNPDRVYCLGQNLVASSNGGESFGTVTSGSHPDFHAIWVDPGNPDRIYVGSDGGFYSTEDPDLLSWTKSVDLPITQFYAGAIDPSNPARILGGTQDNNTPIRGFSEFDWYAYYNVGDGFYCLIDPTNSSIGFAEYQNMSGGTGPKRTTNNGAVWSTPAGFVTGDRYNWCAPFTMSPSNHNVLLAGSHRVYRSTDNGVNYSAISPDLTRNLSSQLSYASTISTLDISAVNGSHYYAGTADGRVWRTTNAGGVWTEITGTLPVRWVTRVTTDPFSTSVVYVTLSGFSLDEFVPHVYRSADMGATWTAIDGNLPDVPANDILVDPIDSNRLYLATDVGVYTTRDLGGTWYPLGVGMPLVPVADLTLHAASRTLVAATHGRSQWTLDLNDLPVSVGGQQPPGRLELSAPAPNPSRGDLRLELSLAGAGWVRAEVFDPSGRRVARLLDRRLETGRHRLEWNGRDEKGARARAGVYLVRVSVDGRASATRRVTRLD
jgi:photosystem II stability/assembly factor-like uncharacterized protein